VFHLPGLGRQHDVLSRADDRGGRLHEEQWNLRHFDILFPCMFGVIAPHTDDFARLHWREQAHRVQRDLGFETAVFPVGDAFHRADPILMHPAITRGFISNDVPHESHTILHFSKI